MTTDRAQVAAKDRELKPLYPSTRPTCDAPGVLLSVILDEGQRPLSGGQSITGRLTEKQALGLARDLELMVSMSREENG